MKKVKSYIVEHADWEPKNLYGPSDPYDPLKDDDGEMPVSDKIDYRTFRERPFDTEEEALEWAEDYLTRRQDDKWLAYINVIEVTRKVKHMICN